ncbi:unnamed protein product [Angiostrongylus costaricensis]|uniref:Reverse transcriptase domain-containing protein n=1 Tax=Angiostrongylus costaricensis TaxID=334426 RepID=A0A0R3PEF4_ANGCS|nr:unnamed protein product [Angiostrongylus costaricensis]
MRTLEWDNMGLKIDGRQLHHLRFADNIAFITLNSQSERMLADFDKSCGKIGLRVNLTKAVFMKNGLVSHSPIHAQPNQYLRMLQLCLWLGELSRASKKY